VKPVQCQSVPLRGRKRLPWRSTEASFVTAALPLLASIWRRQQNPKRCRRQASVAVAPADPYRTGENEIMFPGAKDKLGVKGWDHLDFVVGNAKQSAAYFQACLGFQPVARRGLETGCKDAASYVLSQGEMIVVLTTPLESESELSSHLKQHGDGVRVVAMQVNDAALAHKTAVELGAVSFFEPVVESDKDGQVVRSAIRAYGDTVHVFVERDAYAGAFLPGYQPWTPSFKPAPVGIKYVDHVVANVGWGEMQDWSGFYKQVFGMEQLVSFDDKDISTEFTALRSVVMTEGSGRVKLPINEPAEGRKKSQIEEFLDFYQGPGVQHIAMATDDILATVTAMRDRGVEFLTVPETYYDQLLDRVGLISEDVELLRQHRILVDRDDSGYMLQIFTRPLADRPTVFLEVIQRRGGTSFGKGNFKALFESIEEEQRRRGTL